jgi:hypothetical protein
MDLMEATLSGCKRHLKTRQYQLAGVVSGRLQPTGIKKDGQLQD